MCNNWNKAYSRYNWEVNLKYFKDAANYPGYFNRVITPADVATFENKFRAAINGNGSFEIAGEVCFWKNYKNAQARNRVTQKLLNHLKNPVNWNSFVQAIKQISSDPSYDNFVELQYACNQRRGFATPITFLAFYNPTEYPMVDKHIANWWAKNKIKFGYESFPAFLQGIYGSILSCKQSWDAYVAWKTFCNDYARRISENCGLSWRARDIEMAVWEAQRNYISLEVLP